LDKCHFGLNLFKSNTIIGLSMKSIEYFRFGLPIISNLSGDTKEIVKRYNVGINYNSTVDENEMLKFYQCNKNINENVRKIYATIFSEQVLKMKWNEVYKVMNDEK
ncbi:TPA: hypothetical protein ACG854_002936, partial [Enterococcus faecium]